MIVSPDSSNSPYNNTSNVPGSPLRNIRMVQVQECSQSQSPSSSSSPLSATNKYVITTKFPITNTQPTPPGIIKVSSLIPNSRPVTSNMNNNNDGITYHTTPSQYPHIAVVTKNTNNNNNEYKVHHHELTSNNQYQVQDYSSKVHTDLNAPPQSQHHHQHHQQQHYQNNQKYPVMDTTVASSTVKGEQDLNIGMSLYVQYNI